ncbi:MAG: hypothetical protein IPJ38_23335 [Dechloromonas sp.]|uniref:Uncharacterized protein n=1 Tax=Candidatus Dechloromonas phosphorivorans TaxID=2899244 RepID=A0A935K795_9RHOO|nr:hypothetical protein [Candidatus Dechloromonas phosphorivorans]
MDSDGVAQQNTVDWVAGLDFSLPAESRLNLQVFQRQYMNYDPYNISTNAKMATAYYFNSKFFTNPGKYKHYLSQVPIDPTGYSAPAPSGVLNVTGEWWLVQTSSMDQPWECSGDMTKRIGFIQKSEAVSDSIQVQMTIRDCQTLRSTRQIA